MNIEHGIPTVAATRNVSVQVNERRIRTREISVTEVAKATTINNIVLTVITHAPWSSGETGRSGGKISVPFAGIALYKSLQNVGPLQNRTVWKCVTWH